MQKFDKCCFGPEGILKSWPTRCIELELPVKEKARTTYHEKRGERGSWQERHPGPALDQFPKRVEPFITASLDKKIHCKIPCAEPLGHLTRRKWTYMTSKIRFNKAYIYTVYSFNLEC